MNKTEIKFSPRLRGEIFAIGAPNIFFFNSAQKMALRTFYFINEHKACEHITT